MTDPTIEKLLLHAPTPLAPPELLQKLQRQIVLPPKNNSTRNGSISNEGPTSLRRWMPALAFGLFLLSCVILIGVQANWIGQLQRQNEALRAATGNLAQLREAYAELESSRSQLAELKQLKTDNEELQQLLAEVAELRRLPEQINQLRAENQQLRAALATSEAAAGSDFFDELQEETRRDQCVNQLKQIGIAIRIWAQDNDDRTPRSFLVMSNLNTARILVCPSDNGRLASAKWDWNEFRDEMSSYELRTTGEQDDLFPDSVVVKCPIHDTYGLADASVQTFNRARFREVQKEGRWYVENIPDPAP